MFDNLLMSMNSKLKKIMSGLETNEGKIDEISTDVGSVGTSVATVQSTSDEIKALIGTEIATQLNTLQENIIAAIPSDSSSGVVKKIARGTMTVSAYYKSGVSNNVAITLSGFTDVSKMSVKLYGGPYVIHEGTDYESYGHVSVYVVSLTATKLTVCPSHSTAYGGSSSTCSYEIIEFY